MAEQMRPSSKKQAPNPAHSYERSDPNREAGMGKLEAEKTRPADHPEEIDHAVPNKPLDHRKNEKE